MDSTSDKCVVVAGGTNAACAGASESKTACLDASTGANACEFKPGWTMGYNTDDERPADDMYVSSTFGNARDDLIPRHLLNPCNDADVLDETGATYVSNCDESQREAADHVGKDSAKSSDPTAVSNFDYDWFMPCAEECAANIRCSEFFLANDGQCFLRRGHKTERTDSTDTSAVTSTTGVDGQPQPGTYYVRKAPSTTADAAALEATQDAVADIKTPTTCPTLHCNGDFVKPDEESDTVDESNFVEEHAAAICNGTPLNLPVSQCDAVSGKHWIRQCNACLIVLVFF